MEPATVIVSVIALAVAGYSAYNMLRSRQAAQSSAAASQSSASTAERASQRQEGIDRAESQRVHFTAHSGHGGDSRVIVQDGNGTAYNVKFNRRLFAENGSVADIWPPDHAEGSALIPFDIGEDDFAVPSVEWTDSDGNLHTQAIT